MASLYELTQDFVGIMQQLEEMELDQETLKDTLDSLQLPIEQKVENIIKYMKSLEALAEARKAEAKRLSELAAKDLKKVENLKQYMASSLQTAGIKNLQAGVFALSFRKGSEVVEVDENRLPTFEEYPAIYVQQKPKLLGKPDLKKMLKSEYKVEIPGVSLVRKPDTLQIN